MRLPYTAEQVVARAKNLTGWYYVYGAKHGDAPLTKKRLQELRSENSQVYTDNYYNKAKKLIGKNCIDCSGFVCYVLGISDIGSWALHDKPSNDSSYKYGSLTAPPVGSVLWRSGHCAIYIGGYKLVEAKGIDYGVICSDYAITKWSAVIIPPFKTVDYENLGWNWDGTGWWYAYGQTKGQFYKNCIKEIDGTMYAFNSDGYNVINPVVKTTERGGIIGISHYEKLSPQ